MMKQASAGIADHKAVNNKLVQNVWRANVNPKLKESVPSERVRMGLQAMAWGAMMAILLVVIILVTIRKRCTTESTLSSTVDVPQNEKEGYTCEFISAVPQAFNGQPYFDTAYWWGFAVPSAWGTFSGTSWEDYCDGLMAKATSTVDFVEQPVIPDWTYSFDDQECTYRTTYYTDLNAFPNAPGSDPLGCSYPEQFSNCTLNGVDTVEGSAIPGAWFSSSSFSSDAPFCPDMIMWHPLSALNSPLDVNATFERLCDVWGQDIGIVLKAVESCTKEQCLPWWSILASALSLAAGVEVAVVLIIVLSYKVSEYLEEKKRREQEQGGGSEEKDNDEEKEQEDAEKDLKSMAKEAGKALLDVGKSIKEAVV